MLTLQDVCTVYSYLLKCVLGRRRKSNWPSTLLQGKKGFILDKMFQQNASKIALFLECYNQLNVFFCFVYHLIFSLEHFIKHKYTIFLKGAYPLICIEPEYIFVCSQRSREFSVGEEYFLLEFTRCW